MNRLPLVLLLAGAVALGSLGAEERKEKKFEPIEIKGTLADTDPQDKKLNHPCKLHRVDFVQGKTYVIDLIAGRQGQDPYLRLEDPKGNPIAEDDDSGGNLNSRIEYTATASGNYQLSATTLNGVVGPYILKIRQKE